VERQIIAGAHDRGHFAVQKTKEMIYNEYFIQNMTKKCILSNRKRGKQEGWLHPLHKEDFPLHTYHIYFLGALDSTSKNYKHILAVIDSVTKFCWPYSTKSTTESKVITKLRGQSNVIGHPACIISDRGSAFSAQDFLQYCDDENIKVVKSTDKWSDSMPFLSQFCQNSV